MSTRLNKYLSITTCLLFIVIGCAIKHRGSDRLDINEESEPHNPLTYDVGLDTLDDEHLKKTGNTKAPEKDTLEQHNSGEDGAINSSLSGSSNRVVIYPTAQKPDYNMYSQSAQDRDDDYEDDDEDYDHDHNDDYEDDDEDHDHDHNDDYEDDEDYDHDHNDYHDEDHDELRDVTNGLGGSRALAGTTTALQFHFDLTVHEGMNFIHIPLKVKSVDGQAISIETLGDLYDVLTEVSYLRAFDHDTQSWENYFGDRTADRSLRSYEGVIAFMNNAMTLRLTGEALDSSVHIHSGTSFIGIPRKPLFPSYSVSNLLLAVPIIVAIIVEDDGQFKTIGRVGDDGDNPITGGQSFILTSTVATNVTFSGEAWGVPQEGK